MAKVSWSNKDLDGGKYSKWQTSLQAKYSWINKNGGKCPKWQKSLIVIKILIMATDQNGKSFCMQNLPVSIKI